MTTLGGERPQRTVLLVEGDEATRNALTDLLVREGYVVWTAGTGHDALGVLRTPLSPIHVVILDLHLPDVSGAVLCEHLHRNHPELPVLAISGRDASEDAAAFVRLGVKQVFHKPIALDDLLAAVAAQCG